MDVRYLYFVKKIGGKRQNDGYVVIQSTRAHWTCKCTVNRSSNFFAGLLILGLVIFLLICQLGKQTIFDARCRVEARR